MQKINQANTYLFDLDFKEDDYSDAMSFSLDLEFIIEYN